MIWGVFSQPKWFSDLACAQESAMEEFLPDQILQKAHSTWAGAGEEGRGRTKSSLGGMKTLENEREQAAESLTAGACWIYDYWLQAWLKWQFPVIASPHLKAGRKYQ